MRKLIKLSFIYSLMISSHHIFAANPVEGFYLGLLGGLSHAPNTQVNFTIDPAIAYTGNVSLGPVGGDFSTSIGYKIQRFRFEGEALFNINSYNQATIGSCTLISPNVLGPRGTCPDAIKNNGLGFKGNTIGLYGLFNVFFDFLSSDPNTNLVPYIGLGGGASIIRNTAQIQNNKFIDNGATPISVTRNTSKSGPALQGILGFSYYIDDYVTIGLDYRYITTMNSKNANTTSSSINNKQFAINTINVTGNFALEKG